MAPYIEIRKEAYMNYCTIQKRYRISTATPKRTHLNGFFQPKPFHAKPIPCNRLSVRRHPNNGLFYDVLYAKQTHFIYMIFGRKRRYSSTGAGLKPALARASSTAISKRVDFKPALCIFFLSKIFLSKSQTKPFL